MCCRVYQYSEAGSNAFGGGVAGLWLFSLSWKSEIVMKKVESENSVEDTIARPLCGCIYTAPDLSSKSGT